MKRNIGDDTIFYVDPQSMSNLAKYDYNLLRGIDMPIYYFCSTYYDCEVDPRLNYRRVFSYNKLPYNWMKALSYMCSWLVILFYVAWLRPKVVHIQWFRIPRFDYTAVRLMQRLFGVKVVFTAHNILPHQGNESKCADVFRKAYHAFDSIIVHSLTTKNELKRTFNIDDQKVVVARHGILPFNISDNQYRATEQEYDKKYAALRGKTVFAALGYQNAYKGTDLLAQVWAGTPELCNNSGAMLLIIGKVNDAAMDLSMIENIPNVICDNRHIPDEEFLYLLRHTDVYLLPYREISQSGAMLTVLTEHVPLLLTDVGSLAEPLDIAPVGWKIPPSDAPALKHALLSLLDHPEDITAIKNNNSAWQKVCQYYNWSDISRLTQRLYRQLL